MMYPGSDGGWANVPPLGPGGTATVLQPYKPSPNISGPSTLEKKRPRPTTKGPCLVITFIWFGGSRPFDGGTHRRAQKRPVFHKPCRHHRTSRVDGTSRGRDRATAHLKETFSAVALPSEKIPYVSQFFARSQLVPLSFSPRKGGTPHLPTSSFPQKDPMPLIDVGGPRLRSRCPFTGKMFGWLAKTLPRHTIIAKGVPPAGAMLAAVGPRAARPSSFSNHGGRQLDNCFPRRSACFREISVAAG